MSGIDAEGHTALQFWKGYLDGAPPLTELITDRHRTPAVSKDREGGIHTIQLPGDIGYRKGITVHTVLSTALQVLLAKYSRTTDVVVGCAMRNRNFLPLRLELPDDTETQIGKKTFDAVASTVHKKKPELVKHSAALPWATLASEISPDNQSYSPVFQVLFTCSDEEYPDFEHGVLTDHNEVDFDIEVVVDLRASKIGFKFRKSVFDELTISRLAEHYSVLVGEVLINRSSVAWHDLTICSSDETKRVIEEFNNTSAVYPDRKCIHDLFEDQAIEYPNAPCVTYHEPGTLLWLTMTYGDLYCRCYAVATQLRRLGIGVDSAVPILMERSHFQLIAIYGTLLAGGCYVPIDADYPADRILHMMNDAKATVLLTHSRLQNKIPTGFRGTKIMIDTVSSDLVDIPAVAQKRRQELNQSPDTNVYIFYTSGTTGLPKGVEVTHRGLVKRAQWLQDFYPITPSDKMIYKTPFTFGISEWELFWPIPFGSQVVITKEGGQKDPEYLVQVTNLQKVTVCTYVPSMLAMLIEYMIGEGLNYTTDMKHVICCGEALPVETCYKFFEVFDPDTTRLHNLYGPTEADMTYWECPKLVPGEDSHTLTKIPIGKPMLNVKVYILDATGNPVPAGVPGELHFGGVTTAKGYLGLPKLTSEKFVPNPFRKTGDCDRMYKTGDCARWRPDGSTLEFLGRVDHQVKLRGFRIELGEIESIIGACKDVIKVAVLVDGTGASARIVAYVEPKTIDVKSLLKTLKEKVPEYMVPSVIMPLERLPLTNRGKLDRKALPKPPKGGAPQAGDDDSEKTVVYAETPNELIVESVWQKILNRAEKIDVHSNFMQFGGNSLLAGRVTTMIRKQTGSMIPSTAMYQHPTIHKIGALCDEHKPDTSKQTGPVIGGNRYKRWGGYSSTSPKVLLFHAVGLLVDSFASTAAFLPGFMYLYSIYYSEGKWAALRFAPIVISLTILAVCVYTVTLKNLLLGKVNPGEYPVWGSFYLRWWLVNNLHKSSVKMISPFVEDTVLFNKYLSAMGASIGDRVSIGTDDVFDPDLITIEDDVVVEKKATIIPHSVENGILTLWPIHINKHCRVLPVGWVTQGTRLAPGTEVGPLSTTGMSARDLRKGSRLWSGISSSQNLARVCLVPLILLMETIAFIPALLFLEWMWEVGLSSFSNESNLKYILLYLCIPWVEKLVVGETFFLMVVAYKWICIGKFKPGRNSPSFSLDLRKWFLERLTHHQQYRFATQPWINTELLAIKYRMLGVNMGFKVQTDYLEILEFDLLSVGRDSVFGSNVTVCPTDHHESRKVFMKQGAQVLDHSTLMPGCVVGRGALCGSSTVGAKFHKFPDLSISTGNQQGKPVQLRVLSGDPSNKANLSHLPPVERDMAIRALENHQNNYTWGMFNIFNILTVMFIAPLPAVADLLTILVWIWMEQLEVFQAEDSYSVALSWAITILVTPPAYCVVQILETLLFIVFKWCVVGKYKEGNYPFYGQYHRKWVIMMAVKEAIGKLLDDIGGTPFIIWFFRSMGSKMGKDVCMLGYGLEYDLFSAGDYCSVGVKCDVTCHTVENMVIKLAKTELKDKATMRAGALVQPGGIILDGGVVMENSQVLKGGEVGEDEIYAGLPAEPAKRVAPELAGSQVASGSSVIYTRQSGMKPYLMIFTVIMALWLIPSMLSTQKASFDTDEIKVRIPTGIVRGEAFYDQYGSAVGYTFAGIPYAEPPTGERRWSPPIPYTTGWSGVRESRRRPGCVDSSGGSEDCLYVDVDIPAERRAAGEKLYPVVVWFHGGCGSDSRPDRHIGKSVVSAVEGVVVVTPSYRVGSMGYFHHPELNETFNFGVLDQRMVLQWVQANAKTFGGDPSSVTIFGQSSGAASVAIHLTSPGSYGLFHKAVMQSPPVSAFTAKTYDTAAAQSRSIITELGTCPKGDLKCMKQARAISVTTTGTQLYKCREGKEGCSGAAWMTCGEHPCPYGPIIDGKDIKDHPWRLIEAGQHAPVPVVIGYRLDDGLRSMNHQEQPPDSASEQQWRLWAEGAFYPISEGVISRHYLSEDFAERATNSNRSASWHAALAAKTDQLYGCGVRRVAEALSRSTKTFVYKCDVPMYQAVHSHLWFNPNMPTKEPTMFERAFVSQFQAYIKAFVASGEPGTGISDTSLQQVKWEEYKDNYLTAKLHVPVAIEPFPALQACSSVWDPHWLEMSSCVSKL